MDANAAGAGFNAYGGAAAADLARDVMVILGAHGGHFAIGMDSSRAGFSIECEWGVAGPDLHAA